MNAKLQLELKGLIQQYGVNAIIEEMANLIAELAHFAMEEGLFNAESALRSQANRLNDVGKNTININKMIYIEQTGLNK